MDTLLVQLAPLNHVRVIVAGRSLPEAAGNYATCCEHFELQKVDDDQAYINFCNNLPLTLDESQIRALALAFDYRPGAFAEVLPKFAAGGVGNV